MNRTFAQIHGRVLVRRGALVLLLGCLFFACSCLIGTFAPAGSSFVEPAFAAKNIAKAKVTMAEKRSYTGKPLKCSPTVTYKKKRLTKNVDYTLAFKNNKKVGKAKVIIKGIGHYRGKKTVTFRICRSLKLHGKLKLVRSSMPYTGSKRKPAVTVKYKKKRLTEGRDYSLKYKHCKKVGTAQVVVTGKGDYGFKLTKDYKITKEGGKIIDLSEWDTVTSWTKVSHRVDNVILRSWVEYSDQSTQRKDYNYNSFANGCERVGLKYGAYGYFNYTTKKQAKKQAKQFWNASFSNGHAPYYLALDIEASMMTKKGSKIATFTQTAVDTLRTCAKEAGLKRIKIGLYISNNNYNTFGFSTATGKQVISSVGFVWIPTYGKNTGKVPSGYAPSHSWDMWQYTSVGRIDGISSKVDISRIRRSGPHGHGMRWYLKR